jgi:hypothetical protein
MVRSRWRQTHTSAESSKDAAAGDSSHERVARKEIGFFDASGRQVGRAEFRGSLASHSGDIPVGLCGKEATVFTPEGQPVAEILSFDKPATVRLIGTKLLVSNGDSSFPEMEQLNMNAYLGTDGEVAVFQVASWGADIVLKAADLTTCAGRCPSSRTPSATSGASTTP